MVSLRRQGQVPQRSAAVQAGASHKLGVVMMRQQPRRRAEAMQAIRLKPTLRRGLGAVNQSGRLREVVTGR